MNPKTGIDSMYPTDARLRLFVRADFARLIQLARHTPDHSNVSLVTTRAIDHNDLYDFASGYIS